jgi:glycerol-3-phosphate cytidylyltransferase
MSNNLFNKNTKKLIKDLQEKYKDQKIGFTCSCFDLLHAGHCLMLKDCKEQCDVLIVGLQTDPTLDRKSKNKPVQSYEERWVTINSIKFVDEVIRYATEDDLLNILKYLNPDIRILGSDWKDKPFTGQELPIKIHWHDRDHDWSTSGLRKRVVKAELEDKQIN